MTAPTVAVTVKIFDAAGNPCADGTIVTAKLSDTEIYQGFIVAGEVSAPTVSGIAVLNLFPNQPSPGGLGTVGSIWTFRASPSTGKTFRATAQVPNSACTLDAIATLPVVGTLTAAAAAAASAAAAAGTAGTQATAAASSATAAAGSATGAAASATTATTQAGTATTQAAAAVGNAAAAAGSAAAAATSAGTATTQAGLATTQVGLATTQATNSAGSASSAGTAATNAAASAVTAGNSAAAAVGSASGAAASAAAAGASEALVAASAAAAAGSASAASTSATAAAGSASTSSTQATASTAQAAAAAGSASAALTSAGNAATSASAANASNALASAEANTATNQATISTNQAIASAASAAASAASAASASGAATQATNSAASAAAATISAAAAAGSASTANADVILTHADVVSTHADVVTTGANAGTATTQAGVSTTQAGNAAASAAAASTSAGTATTQAGTSTAQATIATTQAGLSAGSASGSAASASAAAGSNTAAQGFALTATAQAALALTYANSAASVAQQDLSGMTAAALHRSPNAITAQFIYDTSKDSDGGAWVDRCQNLSWYNEPLNGTWLGAQTSESAARAVAKKAYPSGPTLISNGTFDIDASWTKGTGVTISGGAAVFTSVAAAQASLYQSTGISNGDWIVVSFDVTGYVSGGVGAFLGAIPSDLPELMANGSYIALIQSNGNANLIFEATRANTTLNVDNVVVRRLSPTATDTGAYFQLTTDGKFYKLWKNRLASSEDLTVGWTLINGGSRTATTITDNSAGVYTSVRQSISGVASGDAWTASISFLKTTGATSFPGASITFAGATVVYGSVTVNTNTGALIAKTGEAPTSIATTVDEGTYWRVAFTTTNNSSGNTTVQLDVYAAVNTDASATWAATAQGSTTATRAQLEYGTAATAYESKVGTDATTTEVFRGNRAKFPRLCAIVAEAASVTIYDLTQPGQPMWMRFFYNSGTGPSGVIQWAGGGNGLNSLFMLNGRLVAGSSASGGVELDFIKDKPKAIFNTGYRINSCQSLAQRNAVNAYTLDATSGYVIASNSVNAVAMTVLPDAPMDPVTGLQVPTIVVGTGTGASVIKHDGSIINLMAASGAIAAISISKTGEIALSGGSGVAYYNGLFKAIPAASVTAADAVFAEGTTPARQGLNGSSGSVLRSVMANKTKLFAMALANSGTIAQINGLQNNNATPAGSSAFYISDKYNTGYMLGDIRRCLMPDTVVGSVSGAQLVTNGDLSAGSASWSSNGSATLAIVGPELQITNGATAYGVAYQAITTVIGKSYAFAFTVRAGTTSSVGAYAGSTAPGSQDLAYTYGGPAGLTTVLGFVATTTTTYISFVNQTNTAGNTGYFTVASVKGAALDRSYKNKPITVYGALTKTAVATAAQLVAYSGFSAANYLQESYSADLEFGAGAWRVSAPVNIPTGALPVSSFPVGAELNLDPTNVNAGAFWTTSSGVTFSGGAIHFSGVASGQGLQRVAGVTIGAYYVITVTVANFVSGNLDIEVGSGAPSSAFTITGNGTYSVLLPCASTTYMSFTARLANSTYDITSISFKQVTGPSVIADRSAATGPAITLGVNAAGALTAIAYDGTTTRTVTTAATYNTGTFLMASAAYTTDGTLAISINGVTVASTTGAAMLPMNGKYNLLTKTEFPGGLADLTTTANIAASTFSGLASNTGLAYPTVGGTLAYGQTPQTFASGVSHVMSVLVTMNDAGGPPVFGSATASNVANDFSIVANNVDINPLTYSVVALGAGVYRVKAPFVGSGVLNSSGVWKYATNSGRAFKTSGWQVEVGPAFTVYQRVNTATDFDFMPTLTIGNSRALSAPFFGSIVWVKIGATVPTAEQAAWMYAQESQMFTPGAQVTLPDAGAIQDLTYDEALDKWVAVSAANESSWTGLVRTATAAASAGSFSKAAAAGGVKLMARITTTPGVDVTIPAQGLREELVNRGYHAARISRLEQEFAFDAITGQTDFVLPAGWTATKVVSAGLRKREGSTKDFIRLWDGFKETIRFAVAPGAAVSLQIDARRIP